MNNKHIYLGDGAYCEYDGYHYILRANHHTDELCTDKVYLEQSVINNLIEFKKSVETQHVEKWPDNFVCKATMSSEEFQKQYLGEWKNPVELIKNDGGE